MKYEKFGYVRVSNKDPNEERQIQNTKDLGIEDRNIFIDKESGRNMNDTLEEFRYSEKHKVSLQFIKELYINVNYNGESTNDIIQSAIQKATVTNRAICVETKKHDIKLSCFFSYNLTNSFTSQTQN